MEYDKDYHPEAVTKLMAKGMLDTEVMAEWGISVNAFYSWIRKHEEFREAVEKGYPKWEKAWVAKGEEQAMKGNTAYYRYWANVMSVKAASAWKAAAKGESTTINNLHVNQMQINNNKSDAELLEMLNTKLSRLRLQGVEASLPAPDSNIIDGAFVEIKDDTKPAE